MRKTSLLAGLLVLFGSMASLAAQGSDPVSGKYEGVAKSDAIGDFPITGHLKNNAGKLSGTFDSDQRSIPITSGTYADGKVTIRLDSNGTELVEERYGLMWGAEVRDGGLGLWPLARVAGQISATDAFMLILSSPGVNGQGLESGRYGQLGPRGERQITEEVLFPIGIRKGRTEVVVIPPYQAIAGEPVRQQILRFNVGRDPLLGQTFALSGGETIKLVAASLVPIIESESEAMWKRVFALSWLAEASERDAAPLLMRYATGGTSEPLQLSAISNLGVFKVKLAVEPLAGLLPKGNEYIKARVIQALGEIGDQTALPYVRPYLKDGKFKALAMESVGKLKDNESVPFLLAQMRKDSREETIPAAESLALIATDSAVDGLIALASDKGARRFPRLRALLALESIGNARALPAAAAILADKNESALHRWAVEVVIALSRKENAEARDVLTKAASDSGVEPSAAKIARDALGQKK